MTQEPSDEQLARAARSGDLDAFRGLVRRHRSRIYSLALRMVRDRAEAEDMAQEAFLRIYRGLASFRGESAFTTWMVRVSLNTFHRYLSRMPREAPLPVPPGGEDRAEEAGPAGGPDPEAGVLASMEADRLRRLVAALPPRFREAVTLFYLQERSVEQAAGALAISAGTLKSRLFRARERLLKLWQEDASPAVARRAGAPRAAEPRTMAARASAARGAASRARGDREPALADPKETGA
jgi:RNA polymerase sigma-70 factor (ECF subfamily)